MWWDTYASTLFVLSQDPTCSGQINNSAIFTFSSTGKLLGKLKDEPLPPTFGGCGLPTGNLWLTGLSTDDNISSLTEYTSKGHVNGVNNFTKNKLALQCSPHTFTDFSYVSMNLPDEILVMKSSNVLYTIYNTFILSS